ncbi:hypothetical protein HZH68_015816 [Vespula germanica]|uniref:Uncharacterized protein n=1 Tax=Vespula germanica TaxID=30212 RepID=A0A834J4U6_VESGE|nr:hypothetical protein HZH68_015816 [Vespula germanica]
MRRRKETQKGSPIDRWQLCSLRIPFQPLDFDRISSPASSLFRLDRIDFGLDNVSSATLRPFNSDINTPRIDSYRFSMANLEARRSERRGSDQLDPRLDTKEICGGFRDPCW